MIPQPDRVEYHKQPAIEKRIPQPAVEKRVPQPAIKKVI